MYGQSVEKFMRQINRKRFWHVFDFVIPKDIDARYGFATLIMRHRGIVFLRFGKFATQLPGLHVAQMRTYFHQMQRNPIRQTETSKYAENILSQCTTSRSQFNQLKRRWWTAFFPFQQTPNCYQLYNDGRNPLINNSTCDYNGNEWLTDLTEYLSDFGRCNEITFLAKHILVHIIAANRVCQHLFHVFGNGDWSGGQYFRGQLFGQSFGALGICFDGKFTFRRWRC